jgi:hypothetical protein
VSGEQSNPPSDPDSELARFGTVLADAVIEAVPGWISGCVVRRYDEWSRSKPASASPEERQSHNHDLEELARDAGDRAGASVAEPLRRLLAADVDEQWTTPLSLVRSLVLFAGEVLAEAGVPPVVRDTFETARFPDDHYRLVPASLSVLGEEVGNLAIAWGAQKALTHRRRHDS